jgi:DNA helicase-2/ATP-dependent DNA helicase PcrA
MSALPSDVRVDSLLRGLDPEQLACVVAPVAPMLVVARAGSGKTLTLTRRIVYRIERGDLDASKTLALTFTRKAAAEIRTRAAKAGHPEIQAGTLHWAGLHVYLRHVQHSGEQRRAITSNPLRLMTEACEKTNIRPIDALRFYERATALCREPIELLDERAAEAGTWLHVLARYGALKKRRGVLDFSDLLRLPTELVADDAAFAASVRWKFKHFFVDEAQDLTPQEWRLIRSLMGESTDLFVVGDPSQAIYGWQQADSRIMTTVFPTQFPGTLRFELPTNYRSTAAVVRVADAVLKPSSPSRPGPFAEPGQVEIRDFENDSAEAGWIALAIKALRAKGVSLNRIAVLARTNDRLSSVAASLEREGIPHHGQHLLSDPMVKSILSEFERTCPNVPAIGCVTIIRELIDETLADLWLRWSPRLDQELDDFVARGEADREPAEVKAARLRLGELLEVVTDWAVEFPNSSHDLLRDYLTGSVRSRGGEPPVRRAGVELATFHRSKGAEWDYVFVIGLEADLVPLQYSNDLDEEKRLLYVALTRARVELNVCWVHRRDGFDCQPSPHLSSLADEIAAISKDLATDPQVQLLRIRALREQLA